MEVFSIELVIEYLSYLHIIGIIYLIIYREQVTITWLKIRRPSLASKRRGNDDVSVCPGSL